MVAPYPVAQPERIDAKADAWMAQLKAVVGACRNLRSEMGLQPKDRVPLLVHGEDDFVADAASLIQSLAKVSEIKSLASDEAFSQAARTAPVVVAGGAQFALLVPIDVEAERARLAKEIGRLRGEIGKIDAKLGNEGFIARAPADVVAQERGRLTGLSQALARLEDRAERLAPST
jgi:valyl-tRNA synthetase